jgi:poly-beta-1,6-N-acetyl-D-glucosamine synthase
MMADRQLALQRSVAVAPSPARKPAGAPVRTLQPRPYKGGMQRRYVPRHETRRERRFYVSTTAKFWIALSIANLWTALSVWVSLSWIDELADHITLIPAIISVTLLAFVPGHLVAFLAAAVLLDKQPRFAPNKRKTAVTVLIAARNEAAAIGDTVRYLAGQDYRGQLQVVLVDNGSTDGTAEVARAAARKTGLKLRVLSESTPGKSNALNRGLLATTTPVVITVDADTLLHRSAVRVLVARLESGPRDVLAVAGNVQVRNSRENIWTRVQTWDYLLGIAAVKRAQGLFQGTLVAQGAFSAYRTDALRAAGGWPDAIGEDIVLTWKMMQHGRVFYEPLAMAYTTAPATLHSLSRQRSRWARGMIEGIRSVPPWRQRTFIAIALTSVDLAIPFLDLAYVFLWWPGVGLACTGRFWIVGPMTVAVIPMTLLLYWILYRYQHRHVLAPLGLRPRRDKRGLLLFLLGYQLLMSTMSVLGYGQELLRLRRSWK